jgi:hypothetical protein
MDSARGPQPLYQTRASFGDDVGVAVRNGIEGSWIDADFHDAVDSEVDTSYR